MKKILITGGTGSFGEKFLTNFLIKKIMKYQSIVGMR